MLRQLNLPPAKLDLSRQGATIYVNCLIRRKKLVLTPEEWVRQHIIYTLLSDYDVSFGLLAVEVGLEYNGRKKRADLVVYDRNGAVDMLIECKAPDVTLDRETLFQIAQYNATFNASKLMVSNGIDHFSILPQAELIVQSGFMNFDQ